MSEIVSNEVAERAVIGSVLIDHLAARRALQLLEPIDFFDDRGRHAFTAIAELIELAPERPIDLTILLAHLGKVGETDPVPASYLSGCVDAVSTADHLEYYARYVRDASIQRSISRQLDVVARERSPENVKRLGDLILELQGNRGVAIFDMRRDLGDLINSLLEKPEPGIKTGIDALDERMGSLKPGNLWTIGARPGGGKTALMLKLAAKMSAHGHEVLYLTTEMEVKEMVQRLLPMASRVSHSKFRNGDFDPGDIGKIMSACSDMSLMPLKIYGRPRLSLDDIRGAVFQAKPKVVFIDYLQRCRLPKAENMAYAIGEFYAELKSFLLEVGVIGFIGCQSDRESDRNPNVAPTMAHLKGSGGIESESDGVMMLWDPPAAAIKDRHDWVPPSPGCNAVELLIRKNRNGMKDVAVDLELDGRLIDMVERQLQHGDMPR